MAVPVFLDVDTGVDDALALLLAVRHSAVELRGVTTVVGNIDLDQVTRNTLQVLELAGAVDVPVVSGARRPLVAPPIMAAEIHGPDGLGGADLRPPRRGPVGTDAAAFLRDQLRAAPDPVTVIALGPLTNLALLLRSAPDVASKIGRIALMGGSAGSGNVTATAEFNIYHDPEAADIVFSSGIPILMYGLDVFRRVTFSAADTDRWFNPDAGQVAGLVGHLLGFMMRNFRREHATIGDAGCVASVIDRSRLSTRRLHVAIETAGRARGQTIVDRRDFIEQPPMGAPVEVALDIDADHYRRLFRGAILAKA